MTGGNARENREKLSIKDHHYKQGKSRETREKCVLDTFISHQFPQAGKHPMPVVPRDARVGRQSEPRAPGSELGCQQRAATRKTTPSALSCRASRPRLPARLLPRLRAADTDERRRVCTMRAMRPTCFSSDGSRATTRQYAPSFPKHAQPRFILPPTVFGQPPRF